MSALNLYKSYNFVDKDPVIDLLRMIIADQHLSYGKISDLSGVSEYTLRGWFDGKTRRPQFATVAAVMGALGYRMTLERVQGPAAKQPPSAMAMIEAARASIGV
jgi:DNA-binding phage protein